MSQTENKAVPAAPARGRTGYPLEFRRDSVAAWRSSGLSASKYAAQIGVDSSTMYTWIRQTDSPLPGVAGGGAPRSVEALEAELRATRAELERTRQQRDILKNFGHSLRTVAERHARITAMKTEYAIDVLCAAFDVARSGYYRHLAQQRQPGPHRQRDGVLAALIIEEFEQSRGTYGVPRLHRVLHDRQQPVSRKRIAHLMRERGLRGCSPCRRYVVTTDSRHDQPIAPNRLPEHGAATRPDQIWVADITYIRTDEGWLYLAGVKDAYTRRMVGWAMSDTIDTPLVLAAWPHARRQRRPAPGLIFPPTAACNTPAPPSAAPWPPPARSPA